MTPAHNVGSGVIQQIDMPMRFYEMSANVFVAGFFGSPAMNFFRGVLADHGGQHLMQGDQTMPLGELGVAHPSIGGFTGREIVVGLRPEDLHLASGNEDGQAASPGFSARLDYIEPVGNEVFRNLRFADRDLVARLAPRPLPAPGSMVRLSFSPARLHCFDAPSGLRIGAADS